jgi:hypothetical protein
MAAAEIEGHPLPFARGAAGLVRPSTNSVLRMWQSIRENPSGAALCYLTAT